MASCMRRKTALPAAALASQDIWARSSSEIRGRPAVVSAAASMLPERIRTGSLTLPLAERADRHDEYSEEREGAEEAAVG